MPTLRFRVTATTANAMATRKFNVVPAGGAIVNLWASCVTITDTFSYAIGDRDIIATSPMNIESSTTVIDNDRDQLLFNELIGAGEQFMPVTVTTAANFLAHLRFLRSVGL